MENNIKQLAHNWITADSDDVDTVSDYYCQTRDIFQARLESMTQYLLKNGILEEDAYTVLTIAGEIGNNSFDHNLGNWPDIMGVFFAYNIFNGKVTIFLADRGQGVLKTLKRVKPELKNDVEALQVAFTERISGRAPENRGNGLKFVKESVESSEINLAFVSGNAQVELNEKMKIRQIKEGIRGCLAIIKYK